LIVVKNWKQFLFIAGLLLIAAGVNPLKAAIWQWSTTASSNAGADPSINWAEGMAPSAVNDSARAMMAVIAAWRNDISGANTTGGSSTAYTLTTSEGVNTTPADGQMIAFIAHATNGISPTLQVDSGNTYPIWSNGAAVGAASLIAGTPYRVSFKTASAAWLLEGAYGNPYNVPLGGLLPYTGATAPNSNFILPAGQCISTTTYAAYWALLGSPASGSCPGGQFQVIDMRGRVPAALDNLNGVAASRLTNGATGCGTAMTSVGATCANGLEGAALTLAQLPTGITSSGSNTISVTSSANSFAWGFTSGAVLTNNGGSWFGAGSLGTMTIGAVSSSGNNTINVTSTNTSGTATPRVQPTVAVTYLLRVL
jgi:hypothetical protein